MATALAFWELALCHLLEFIHLLLLFFLLADRAYFLNVAVLIIFHFSIGEYLVWHNILT